MSRRAESSLRYTRATEVASLRSVRRTRPPRRWAARLRASPSPLRTNRYCLVLPTHVPSRSGIDSWTARLFGGRARPVTGYHVAVCVHDPYRACSRQRCEVRDETDRLALLSILGTGHKHGDRTYMASVTALAWGTPDGCTPTRPDEPTMKPALLTLDNNVCMYMQVRFPSCLALPRLLTRNQFIKLGA